MKSQSSAPLSRLHQFDEYDGRRTARTAKCRQSCATRAVEVRPQRGILPVARSSVPVIRGVARRA